MGAAVATQRTLDLNAVSKELRSLGAATRKRVLDAVRAGELRPHMLLNTTPKDLARLGFAGDALQDVQVALASVRQGETDRLAAIEAHKERERFEVGSRAATEVQRMWRGFWLRYAATRGKKGKKGKGGKKDKKGKKKK